MYDRRHHSAFSLMEMLVVIALIVLLISITLPSLNKARCRAEMTQCLSNMGQMGDAMHSFTVDHDGKLPGPSWYGQSARVSRGTLSVSRFLAPYLGVIIPATGTGVNTTFICPSFSRVAPAGFNPADCVIYGAMSEPRSDGKRVFGYPAFDSNPRYEPSKLTVVKSPSSAKAIRDIDFQLNGNAGWGERTAVTPIHCYTGGTDTFRNYLFFDSHAESIYEDITHPLP